MLTITKYESNFLKVCILLGATQASTQASTQTLLGSSTGNRVLPLYDVKTCHKFGKPFISHDPTLFIGNIMHLELLTDALMTLFQWQHFRRAVEHLVHDINKDTTYEICLMSS